MRVVLALVTLLAVSSGTRLASGESTFAVVRSNAKLRVAPSHDAATFAVGTADRADQGFDVEVLGRSGDFIKIRSLESARCFDTIGLFGELGVIFYVTEADLHTVLTEPLSLDLGDGQRFEALAGVPFDGEALRISGVAIELALPEDVFASSYSSGSDHFPMTGDNAKLKAGIWRGGDVIVKTNDRQPVVLDDVGGYANATLNRRCLRVSLNVLQEEFQRERGVYGSLIGRGSHGLRWKIPKGTALSWPGGRHAGVTRSDVDLSVDKGKRMTCFVRSLDKAQVRLCVKSRRLRKIKQPPGVLGGVFLGGPSLGTVTVGKPRVSRGLDSAIVQRVVRSRQYQLRRCARTQLARGVRLGPTKMKVRWRISMAGRVEGVRITPRTKKLAPLARCIKAELLQFRFPVPKRVVRVSYPVVFH